MINSSARIFQDGEQFMNKKITTARVLAWIGTPLVWFPILATLVTGITISTRSQIFHFDYLLPAELFPLAGVGGLMLFISALLAKVQRKWIIWSFAVMILALVASQVLAIVSGIASGIAEPVGIWWILVLVLLAVYTLAMIALGVGGIRLLKSVYSRKQKEIQPDLLAN
jgi:signal transduction histidine kinase